MTVVVSAGRYKWPITFQSKRKEGDGAGSWSEHWDDLAGDRVEIKPISASERIRSAQEEVVITHYLEGRYRPDVDDTMRIVLKKTANSTRVLEIKHIINVDEANVINQYLCTEVK